MTTNAATFAGLRVAAFESRRADDMARMIAKKGGVPLVSPSMREVPLDQNPQARNLRKSKFRPSSSPVQAMLFRSR